MGVGGQCHALTTLPPGKTRYPLFAKYIIIQKFSVCLVLLYLLKASISFEQATQSNNHHDPVLTHTTYNWECYTDPCTQR